MKRAELVVLVTIVTILLVTLYRYSHKPQKVVHNRSSNINSHFTLPKDANLSEELIIDYIVNVINYGSNHLGFQQEGMEGGFVPKEKARDVACYVYELSGKKCSKTYAKDAALYFSSNCASCHGNDGKGLNGTFPNLTRERLLGLEK